MMHSVSIRWIVVAILMTITPIVYGQSIQEMQPVLGCLIDKSLQGEIDFIKLQDQCEKFWAEHQGEFNENKLTASEKKLFEQCQTEVVSYWDVIGPGCSWYCGGGLDTNSASS